MRRAPARSVRRAAVVIFIFAVSPLLHAQIAPPSSLSVDASPASSQVTLAWPAVSGATGYNVKRATSLGGGATTLASGTAALTFTDSTATVGTRYYYSVTALNGALESTPRGAWASPCVIVDNATAGNTSAGVSFTGTWAASAVAGSFGNASLFAAQVSGGTPTATYTFTPTISARGLYDVYLRWTTNANRATNTPVDLVLSDETRTVTVNQQTNGGQWNLIATVPCEAGATMSVVIRNNGANGNVIADGVQLVPRHAPWAPTADTPTDYTLLPLTDDFDGTAIDSSVWTGFAGRNNYSVSGGRLRTKLSYIGSVPIGSATTAELKNEANWSEGGITSREGQKFGYHEARLRLPQAPATGVDVAYWHGALDEYLRGYEIDAPEFFLSRTNPAQNSYGFGVWDHFSGDRTWHYGDDFSALGDMTRYITIGLEWRTDNSQVVYINGAKVYTVPTSGMNDTQAIQGSSIILSTKVLDWLNPSVALDGEEAQWDYVRYYQKPGWLGTVDGTWDNAANWGPDGLPGPGFAAVINVPTAAAAISLSSDQTLQSLYLDGETLPAHTFSGPGKFVLGAGKPGDASCTHGGIAMNTSVAVDQTFNTAIVGVQNLQFANHSRSTGVALRLNGQISGDGVAPRDVDFLMPIAGSTTHGAIVLGQPLGTGIRHIHKAGDTPFTLPANSQHDGELRISRGPVTISAISALGTNSTSAVLLYPRYLHSDSWRPRLTYAGPAATSDHAIRMDGRFPDGIIESNGSGPLTWTGNVLFGNGGSPSTVRAASIRLTLGATTSSGNNIFSGNISDADVVTTITNPDSSTSTIPAKLSLIKSGSGTWILTGTNSLSANVSVSQGKLFIGNGTSGSLALTAPAGISVGSTAELGLGRDDAVDFSATISGAGAFRKRGTGTLTLAGNHTFTGNATVEAGTLNLTGSLASGGTMTVNAAGTLRGSGTSAKNASINGTLVASPLTFTGTLTLASTSKLRATFTGNNATGIEPISAAGVTVTSGAKVDVVLNEPGSTANFIQSFWRTARTFPLLTATAKTGSLAIGAVSTDSAGNSAATYGSFSLEQTSTAVNLVWTPLPGFPVVDEPTLAIVSPAANPVAIADAGMSLRLVATVGGGPTTTIAWTLVNGPGTVTSPDANAADTTVQFSAAGKYVLRATATNALGIVSADIAVFVDPATSISLRQGVNGYSHGATFIRGDSATWNSGARDQLLVGRNNGGMRALLAFDLTSVPTDVPVQSATLDLWTAATGSGTALEALQLHRLAGVFVEGTGDGSSAANGTGTGADWDTQTGAPGSAWSVAGGVAGTDYDSTPLATIGGFNPASTAAGTQFTFASTPAWIAAISAATAAAAPLSLMLIADGDAAAGSAFARFASDDHATLARRPILTINFAYQFAPAVTLGSAPDAVVGVAASLSAIANGATSGAWTLVSGPGVVSFTDAAAATTIATFAQSGSYVLRFSAANALGETSRTLTVNVVSRLESWRQVHFGATANTGSGADPFDANGDGETNLMEFATGQNPTAATTATPALEKSGATLEFTYTRSLAAISDGVTFTVEWSDSLAAGSWSAVGVTEQILSDNGIVQTVKATVSIGAGGRRFLRLNITDS